MTLKVLEDQQAQRRGDRQAGEGGGQDRDDQPGRAHRQPQHQHDGADRDDGDRQRRARPGCRTPRPPAASAPVRRTRDAVGGVERQACARRRGSPGWPPAPGSQLAEVELGIDQDDLAQLARVGGPPLIRLRQEKKAGLPALQLLQRVGERAPSACDSAESVRLAGGDALQRGATASPSGRAATGRPPSAPGTARRRSAGPCWTSRRRWARTAGPSCAQNGPPSGRRTVVKVSGSAAQLVGQRRGGCSASSGVAPSTTTTIWSAVCGKAWRSASSRPPVGQLGRQEVVGVGVDLEVGGDEGHRHGGQHGAGQGHRQGVAGAQPDNAGDQRRPVGGLAHAGRLVTPPGRTPARPWRWPWACASRAPWL